MKRRDFLRCTMVGVGGVLGLQAVATGSTATARNGYHVKSFELEELSIAQLQDLMERHKATAVSLVKKYQARIKAIDRGGPRLNSIIELNPDALAIAADLDKERIAKGPRG